MFFRVFLLSRCFSVCKALCVLGGALCGMSDAVYMYSPKPQTKWFNDVIMRDILTRNISFFVKI
jgi:hypothetical protein